MNFEKKTQQGKNNFMPAELGQNQIGGRTIGGGPSVSGADHAGKLSKNTQCMQEPLLAFIAAGCPII